VLALDLTVAGRWVALANTLVNKTKCTIRGIDGAGVLLNQLQVNGLSLVVITSTAGWCRLASSPQQVKACIALILRLLPQRAVNHILSELVGTPGSSICHSFSFTSNRTESAVQAEKAVKAPLEASLVVARKLSGSLANAGYSHRFIHGFYEQREAKEILPNHTV